MSQAFMALAVWLHSLATVVFIGHYLLLAAIYLPVLANGGETFLSEISKRSRSWMYGSLTIFLLTGVYLMFADPNYLGIGKFGNFWSVLMLVKHILILGMLGLGFWFNGILHVGPRMNSNTGAGQALVQFRGYAKMMTALGILVLLLTAISQAQ